MVSILALDLLLVLISSQSLWRKIHTLLHAHVGRVPKCVVILPAPQSTSHPWKLPGQRESLSFPCLYPLLSAVKRWRRGETATAVVMYGFISLDYLKLLFKMRFAVSYFWLSLTEKVCHLSTSWTPVAFIVLDVACLGALQCPLSTKVGRVVTAPCQLDMQDFLRQGLCNPLSAQKRKSNYSMRKKKLLKITLLLQSVVWWDCKVSEPCAQVYNPNTGLS